MTTITQEQLDIFKEVYPDNEKIQALELQEVLEHTKGKTVDWSSIQFVEPEVMLEVAISPCQKAIGYVIFDVFCLAFAAVGLRSTVRASTVEAMAAAAGPVMSKLEIIIAKMAAEGASKTDLAWGVFNILKTIYSGGCLGAVFSAFTNSLTWWDMILYGIMGIATIVAALATDGLAFVAEVVILLATFGFLVSDSVKAAKACG